MKRILIGGTLFAGLIALAISTVGGHVSKPNRRAAFIDYQQAAVAAYPLPPGPPTIVPNTPVTQTDTTTPPATTAVTTTTATAGGVAGSVTRSNGRGTAGVRATGARKAVRVVMPAVKSVKPVKGELPFTGLSLTALILLAAALMALGLFIRLAQRVSDRRRATPA